MEDLVDQSSSSTDEKRETKVLPHDSMVTVRLSEPVELEVVTKDLAEMGVLDKDSSGNEDLATPDLNIVDTDSLGVSSADMLPAAEDLSANVIHDSAVESTPRRGTTASTESQSSVNSDEVNWEELEKTEEQEPRNQDSEDSTALLLARLEQENNLLVTNPKSGYAKVHAEPPKQQSRPLSIHQLRQLVKGPTPPNLRYSLIPPPPMTDLEFYAALVQDYTRTAQRLPTLLSKKIRSGVPPPLRGVVWQSMSGARDIQLEEEFDRLCSESSPYEGIIGKDLGRSFPGVEMFRDPEGDGQRMLGRVLKCFSLYDDKIGYCQGLGFLVGPLLMHMGDKQAFCVLVRLMEHYDLRSCFLPDLSGLHVRIYQFRELLKRHLPTLSAHLDVLQVEPAYVSQWFLSFFAVTCPLPMLFRIYDVIFAEGASETIMRVALSVMRKNEEKIMACTEFEDVMQLLLSRGLWDCYHYNADEFVNDFVSLTSVVTNETLHALETAYKESRSSDAATSPSSDIVSAGSRFLGRLWNSTSKNTLSPHTAPSTRSASFLLQRSNSKQSIASTLNSIDTGAESIMSSNSTDATSLSERESSNADSQSLRAPSTMFTGSRLMANSHKNLNGQIEDLLTALSEMQKDHALLATQLQKEREEREEDRHVVNSLLDVLRRKSSSETLLTATTGESLETVKQSALEENELVEEKTDEVSIAGLASAAATAGASKAIASTGSKAASASAKIEPDHIEIGPKNEIITFETDTDAEVVADQVEADEVAQETEDNDLGRLIELTADQFAKKDYRRSSVLTSKSQLRDELARAKEQLVVEMSKNQDLNRRLYDIEQELSSAREQVKEGHAHIRNGHQEKHRLEKLIHELRSRKPTSSPKVDDGNEWPRRSSTNHAGLRELKLGRSDSVRNQATPAFTKRSSSLSVATVYEKENEPPQPLQRSNSQDSSPATTLPPTPTAVDSDALILELVQAKTAEAVAKQEAEEAKAKLESLRKLLGVGHNHGHAEHGHRVGTSMHGMGLFDKSHTMTEVMPASRSNSMSPAVSASSTSAGTTPASATGGGFWGWGKRNTSTTGL